MNELQELDAPSLFGEANILAAEAIFNELLEVEPDIDGPSIKKGLEESVVKECIGLIDWRTGGKNDPGFLASILTWLLLGNYYTKMESLDEVPIRDVVYFIGLSEAVNTPNTDKITEEVIIKMYQNQPEARYVFTKCVEAFFGSTEGG